MTKRGYQVPAKAEPWTPEEYRAEIAKVKKPGTPTQQVKFAEMQDRADEILSKIDELYALLPSEKKLLAVRAREAMAELKVEMEVEEVHKFHKNNPGKPDNPGNPMFSKKHYEFIAKIISDMPLSDSDRGRVGGEFAVKFAKDNPKFDILKFESAVAEVEEDEENEENKEEFHCVGCEETEENDNTDMCPQCGEHFTDCVCEERDEFEEEE